MRIRKKRVIICGLALLSLVISMMISFRAFLFLILFYLLLIFAGVCFLILNKLLKHTNWWKNKFVFTRQFVSNEGYRDDLHRNYVIANVGSNPARFAFHYVDVLGENWSTGTQGLDMDYEVLRYFHSYLREGSYVLLPIVPFSSVSGFLDKEPPEKCYLAKFASILDTLQCRLHSQLCKVKWYLRYPLLYEWKALRFLICDVNPDNRLVISENPMSLMDMEKDAVKWINGWKDEFSIKELNGSLPDHLIDGRNKSIAMMRKMIEFLQERGYHPVIISPPVSASLSVYFTDEVRKAYIYSFVDSLKDLNVPYLDYMSDEEYTKNEYYFNALFLNLRGRKLFTKQVLKDLGIE